MTALETSPLPDAQTRSQSIALRRGLAMLGMTLVVPGSAQLAGGNERLGGEQCEEKENASDHVGISRIRISMRRFSAASGSPGTFSSRSA